MEAKYKNTGTLTRVDAIYTTPMDSNDIGNIFIEALSKPLINKDEIKQAYFVPIIHTNSEMKMSKQDRRFLLSRIREFRMPLDFDADLEKKFYDSLCESYRRRKLVKDACGTPTLYGDVADDTSSGFALLGISGSGKSSALKILLSHYPQTIFHYDNGNRFTQIVYLVVCCTNNSNFRQLYNDIANAIDKALGVDMYETQMTSIKTLGGKKHYLEKLIESFAIGTIIIDEIQLMDFSANKESTYQSLMTISNNTKVAISVVGTDEAYNNIFNSLQTARRVGQSIDASAYIKNKKTYQILIQRLMELNWTDQKLSSTELDINEFSSIVNAFYEETCGLVAQTVSLWIRVQDEWLKSSKSHKIDAEYIKKISNKYFKGLKDLINNATKNYHQIENILLNDQIKLDNELNRNDFIESIVFDDKESLIMDVINRVSLIEDIEPNKIKDECYKLLKDKPTTSFTPQKLAKDVLLSLNRKKKPAHSNDIFSTIVKTNNE